MVSFVRIIAVAVGLALGFSMGCAIGDWKSALREDSPAAYARFLRNHPGSRYAGRASAHLEFLRVKQKPSLDALTRFRERFPESPLSRELQPILEQAAFEVARAAGTAEAYRDFIGEFPDSSLAARSAGNAAYLVRPNREYSVAELVSFANDHPESDFAPEARRSASALDLRERTHFERVGLWIDISPSTPEADRLLRTFTERAMARYQAAGIALVPVPELRTQARDAHIPAARLQIQHSESLVAPGMLGDRLSPPQIVAKTVVRLRIGEKGPLIWEREFSVSASQSSHSVESSLLFGSTGQEYWNSFFVPIATWQSNGAIRVHVNLAKPVADVDATGSRAVVLFRDGDLQVLDLSDPTSPVVLAERRRERPDRDYERWNGVRVLGDRIALFGDEGLEVVRSRGMSTRVSLRRGEIGSLTAVEAVGDSLILAGKRGLMLVEPDASEPTSLLRRDIRGLAKLGDGLIFSDGESLFLSTLPLLRAGRVSARLHLGRGFGPGRIRSFDSNAVVIGDAGVLVLDIRDPNQPRVLSQLYVRQLGRVVDAGEARGRIFLLGERGLQLLDPTLRRIEDSVDVDARERAASLGRHIVSVGESGIQVVDSTPFSAVATPDGFDARTRSEDRVSDPASAEGW